MYSLFFPGKTILRFIHTVVYQQFIPFIAESYSIVKIHHNLFTHSHADGCLGCFQLGATADKAAVNICVQVFV